MKGVQILIRISDKTKCCGCSSCANACPKQCITMQADNEGFLYPVADASVCINCGVCEKVCPILSVQKSTPFEQKAYVIQNKNERVLRESTSGGAFTAIAEYVIDRNGVVFGAAFDADFKVIHTYAETKDELRKFRNSKYVQSDTIDSFKKVKDFLTKGKLVCFSGTPCQIEGLRSFLCRDYENLILIDVVCHAVPSPLVWEKYKTFLLEHEKMLDAKFRDKEPYGYQYSQMTLTSFNKKIVNGVESDYYLRAFFANLSDRPSCYQCHFKERYRNADFTIWDCWDARKFDNIFDNSAGATCILAHSQKAQNAVSGIFRTCKCVEVSADEICSSIKEMTNSVPMNPKREAFFKDMNEMTDKDFFEKYFPMTFKVRFERFIRKFSHKLGVYEIAKKIGKSVWKNKRR